MSHYISRRLTYFDEQRNLVSFAEEEISAQSPPLVVLGDPGMGKTELLLKLGKQPGHHYLTAAQFLRQPPAHLPGGILVLDALDEVSSSRDSDSLDWLLQRLGESGWPPFILSCRSADWQGSRRAQAIADDYGRPARVLTLHPLSEEESLALLIAKLGSDAAMDFHGALSRHGLTELLFNPQSLRMLAEVAEDGVPAGRADLFERAALKMVAEHNEAHVQSELNRLDPDHILDGAGAAMAILLLNGKEGLFTGLQAQTPLELEHVARITALPLAGHCPAALKSRLFRTRDDARSTTYCHRTVAEYLGARWIGRVVEASYDPDRMVKRLLSLIHAGGRVPASFRGLHAWLAYHSRHFAEAVIEADPYGVIRYGDLGAVSCEIAGRVWASLEGKAREDPWFRAGDWQSFTVAGLVQAGQGQTLARILRDPGSSHHLRSLVLDLLPGGACLSELHETLVGIIRDPEATFSERHNAIHLLKSDDRDVDWPALLREICQSGDVDAPRLADEAIMQVGIDRFSDEDIVNIVFAQSGGYARQDAGVRRGRFEDLWSLSETVPVERCAGLLDSLVTRFGVGGVDAALAEHNSAFGRLVWTLIARQIPAAPPDARQLWRWLSGFAGYYASEPDARANTAAWLAGNPQIRQAIQAQMLLTEEGAESMRRNHWHIGTLSQGLYCQEDDTVGLLDALASSGRRDELGREAFQSLVRGWSTDGTWTPRMAEAAERCAAGDPALMAILHPPPVPKRRWGSKLLRELEADQRKAKRKRAKRRDADRKHVLGKLDELGEGLGPAAALALCFLGRGKYGGHDCLPEERIGAWVGDDVHPLALAGFEAALNRPLDATLHEITARLLPRDDAHDAIWPVVAGLAQRLRDGRGFDGVSEDHLLAGLIAQRLKLHTVDKHLRGLGEALDAFAMADAGRFERFIRALIEPQLEVDERYVSGAHYLLSDNNHHLLRARLLLEWFDELARRIGADIKVFVDALLDAPAPLQAEAGKHVDQLIAEAPARFDGADQSAYWTALNVVRDFDTARAALEAAADDPAFLWELSRAIGYDRFGERKPRPVPIDRLAWIFERFEARWPNVERPRGPGSGSRNPWDASEILGGILFQMARDTSPDAMHILHRLAERGSGSYGETLRAARAKQRERAAEAHYSPPGLESVAAALTETRPRTAADLRAVVLDALANLQRRIVGSSTDPVDLFYDGDRPKDEERCRNAVLDLLGPNLPFGIIWAPEERMPNGKRADAGFRLGECRVPLEVKLDRNRALWTAPAEQLDRLYSSADYMASGLGIYLVFWFGAQKSARRRIPRPPRGTAPGSASELEELLKGQLADGAGGRVSIVVLDLARRARRP